MAGSDQASDRSKANADLMVRLLTHPRSGSVMEWFVLLAMEEFADHIIEKGAKGLDNPMIDPDALIACAKEVKDAMEGWQI